MDALVRTIREADTFGRSLPPNEDYPSVVGTVEIAIVVVSFLAHWALFKLWYPKACDAPYRSRVASQFHSVVTVAAVVMHYLGPDPIWPHDPSAMWRVLHGDPARGDTAAVYVVCFSLGYFISDLVVMALHRDVTDAFAIGHHLVVGGGFALGLVHRTTTPFHLLFLIEELSTIPLNAKWFARSGSAAVKQALDLAFALTFVVSRFVLGGYLYTSALLTMVSARHYLTQTQFVVYCIELLFVSSSRVLNSYWLFLIARKVAALCCGGSSKRSKTQQQKEKKNA